jgi:hypothetical protein
MLEKQKLRYVEVILIHFHWRPLGIVKFLLLFVKILYNETRSHVFCKMTVSVGCISNIKGSNWNKIGVWDRGESILNLTSDRNGLYATAVPSHRQPEARIY